MSQPDPFAFKFAVAGGLFLTATALLLFVGEQQKRVAPRSYWLALWQAFWAAVCWFDAWRYR